MIREALDKLNELFNAGTFPRAVTPPGEPSHRYYLAEGEGVGRFVEAEPAPRDHSARNLQPIIAWAKEVGTTCSIWFSRCGITLLMDEDNRRDKVSLDLNLSPQMVKVLELQTKNIFSQRELIFLLRTTFARCQDKCPAFLKALRDLKFKVNSEGGGNIQHGKTSIGKSVMQEVLQQDLLPEYVTLVVPIFENAYFALPQSIEFAVEIHPAEEKFQLIPIPGAIEDAIERAEAEIGLKITAMLEGANVGVYYGEP